MIVIVGAMAKMQVKLYQTIGGVMHLPKDERCPLEYQLQWCRFQTTVQHQNDLVGYRLASLLTAMNEVI